MHKSELGQAHRLPTLQLRARTGLAGPSLATLYIGFPGAVCLVLRELALLVGLLLHFALGRGLNRHGKRRFYN